MNLPGETEAGSAGMQPRPRDSLCGLIEPMFSSAGAHPLALYTYNDRKTSDDRPRCLENPRPEGAESTLTENAASPFPVEPAQGQHGTRGPKERRYGARQVRLGRAPVDMRLRAKVRQSGPSSPGEPCP